MPATQVPSSVAELVPHFKEEQVFIIQAFIVHSIRESGRKGVVVGLSGGVDPARVSKLGADAIGPRRGLAGAKAGGRGGDRPREARNRGRGLGTQLRGVAVGAGGTAF